MLTEVESMGDGVNRNERTSLSRCKMEELDGRVERFIRLVDDKDVV
jgi:hypothetical protein